MLDLYDYIAGWSIYLICGTVCYMIFYRFTGVIKTKVVANTLRAILIALMFTPWYVASEADLMAPALMVMMLDMITLGRTAFVRALVPLVLSIAFCVIVALIFTLLRSALRRKASSAAS